MRRFALFAYRLLAAFGIDVIRMAYGFMGVPRYLLSMIRFRAQTKGEHCFPFGMPYPCLADYYEQSGQISTHYFHQDLHVARRIFEANPQRHIDIGSRIDGFVAHVASFRPIEVLDIRPLDQNLPNIVFRQADFMAELAEDLVESCDSVSCLHALEHFGLGRYGDEIRADGDLMGLRNLTRILRPGGTLYLSVPIGPSRVEFNAHKVFSVQYLFDFLQEEFSLIALSVVDDSGVFHKNVLVDTDSVFGNYGCVYGCGIFEMKKNTK
jgi:SAM-dependent methyltransferase